MLISVGWVPPYWCPSRRLLRSRGEGRGLVTRSKIAPIPGPRLRRWLEIVITVSGLRRPRCVRPSGGQRHDARDRPGEGGHRSEEHTSELQSHLNLVCRLLLEKKKVGRDGWEVAPYLVPAGGAHC